MSVDDPAILATQKAVEDDPILAVIDERIAAIEAAVPPDLTKIAVGGPSALRLSGRRLAGRGNFAMRRCSRQKDDSVAIDF